VQEPKPPPTPEILAPIVPGTTLPVALKRKKTAGAAEHGDQQLTLLGECFETASMLLAL